MMFKRWIQKSFIVGMSLAVLAPQLTYAYGESSTIDVTLNTTSIVPLIKPKWGNFILHKDSLVKLYSQRGYQAIWLGSDGRPTPMLESLKQILMAADRHGLAPSDYWDPEIQNIYQKTLQNPNNWITLELMASEALIRYVSHLSAGRVDPEQVDTDIKFKKKEFAEFKQLSSAVSGAPSSLVSALDAFAPSHYRYYELLDILRQLKDMKERGGWVTLTSPGVALKLGVKSPIIERLRTRFNQLGYRISNNGKDIFDAEFDSVLRNYQAANGLDADGVIGTNSEVLRSLNVTVDERIAQVEATLEKIRWIPKSIEARHIFVNLATTEFYLFDNGETVFHFKTINGQGFRRTPSMRDQLDYVNLNPYWTVPRSIALKDKLSEIKRDPNYLKKNNMLLVDEATDTVVDPMSIDWANMTNQKFTYYIRQLPGSKNALGVVKFPLRNPWAIYLHDTNDRKLFDQDKRHLSSGCVRLQDPIGLATYLLQDQQGWSRYDIESFVPQDGSNYIPGELDKKVYLKKSMPVYFLYLTVEKGADGSVRFINDVYGQDERLIKAIQNSKAPNELF